MRDFILKKVKEGAEEMYSIHGRINPWRLTRSIHIGTEVIREALIELGYSQENHGNFVLKGDRGKAAAKEPKRLEDADISSFKVSNGMEFSNQDFIQDREEEDYTIFSLHELRLIASNKGIEVAFSMTKGELIKKLKSNLK